MTIPLTGSSGLFPRLAAHGALLDAVTLWNGTTVPAAVQSLLDEYDQAEALIDGTSPTLRSYQDGAGGLLSFLAGVAQQTLVTMATDDVNLPDAQLSTAMAELIRQMNAAVATVQRSVVTSATSPASGNTTDGQVVISLKTRAGLLLENAFAEPVTVSVTSDGQSGGATLGQESLLFQGGSSQPDSLSWLWPTGSGASLDSSAVDAGDDASSLLLNGGFETWTVANTPDDWTIAIGTPGVTLFKTTSQVYKGTAALQVTGDGSQLTALSQVPQDFPALTQFAVNFWLKMSSAPGAGVLRVALVDGSGNVINDQAGTANSTTVNLTAAATSYAPHQVVFRTPLLMPVGATLQFKLTTALSAGVSLYLDQVGMTPMEQLYQGGPYLAAFSGALPFTSLDRFTVTVSNDYGGAGSFQTLFNRLYNMNALGFLLPSSATPSIANY